MNLEQFKKTAARKKSKLRAFLKKLDETVPEDMPRLVKETDQKVWQDVHCMECANCCKTMTPTFSNKDIARIAVHLSMTPQAFIKKWLKKDEEGKEWVNKLQPCQFLKANKCSIYDVRPKDCAEFPHHNKKPFDAYNDTFLNNLERCPATFELINRLQQRVEAEYVW